MSGMAGMDMGGMTKAGGAAMGGAGAITAGTGSGIEALGALFGNTGEMTFPFKWPALGTAVKGGLSLAQQIKDSLDAAYQKYRSAYLSNYPATKTATGQEIGTIDQFYNGQMASQLAQLRAAQNAAGIDAANLYSNRAIRGVNSGLLGMPGGGSSYGSRMLIDATAPYYVQAAQADAAAQRADLGYLTQNQLGLAGQRQKMMADLAAYGLVPENVRQQNFGNYLGNLAALEQLFNQGTYSKYNPSETEIIGGALKEQGGYLMSAGAAAGGGGGGGGPAPNTTTGQARYSGLAPVAPMSADAFQNYLYAGGMPGGGPTQSFAPQGLWGGSNAYLPYYSMAPTVNYGVPQGSSIWGGGL